MMLLMSTLLSISTCKINEAQQQLVNETQQDLAVIEKHLPAKNLLNVPYGGDTAQKMDVYLPEGRSSSKTKVIVLIHGGGWNAGNKTDLTYYINLFRSKLPDYAIFNLNYRLVSSTNKFPVQEEDIRTALHFIASSNEEYQVNKDNIALLGVSAGAHLALLQAYKYSEIKVKAVIDFFGPTDLVTMYNKPWHPLIPYLMEMATGTTPSNNINIFKQSSPVNFVTTQSAPTLIFHGSRDNIVDISQSKILKKKLEEYGVANELIVYQNEGHGWYGATLNKSFEKIESFLNDHVD